MRLYETTFIVNPQVDDAAIDRQVSAVAELIRNNQGEIVREDRLGTRRLAYGIAGLTQGFYASFIFKAPAGVLPLLERHYKLEEPYVRHLTIKYERDIADLDAERESRPAFDERSETERPVIRAAAPATPRVEAEVEKTVVAVEEPAPKRVEAPVVKPAPAEPETPASDEEL